MKILLIGNLSDRRCGFQNYTQQFITAFQRAGVDLHIWDGTYPVVYARQQLPDTPYIGLFPADVATYDVIHLIWHAMTMNHYNGADWTGLRALPHGGPLISWMDGGPSNTFCPFAEHMQIKWSAYDRAAEGYHYYWYPIPDWITDLPLPAREFTVGASSVRGDGIGLIREVCERQGWAMNLPVPGQWLPLEDEIRRLARSTVNVSWYNTPPLWKDRAGAPSTALASHRPLLITNDALLGHLAGYPDLYHGVWGGTEENDLEDCLRRIHADWSGLHLRMPSQVLDDLSWTRSVAAHLVVWQQALEARRG